MRARTKRGDQLASPGGQRQKCARILQPRRGEGPSSAAHPQQRAGEHARTLRRRLDRNRGKIDRGDFGAHMRKESGVAFFRPRPEMTSSNPGLSRNSCPMYWRYPCETTLKAINQSAMQRRAARPSVSQRAWGVLLGCAARLGAPRNEGSPESTQRRSYSPTRTARARSTSSDGSPYTQCPPPCVRGRMRGIAEPRLAPRMALPTAPAEAAEAAAAGRTARTPLLRFRWWSWRAIRRLSARVGSGGGGGGAGPTGPPRLRRRPAMTRRRFRPCSQA